MGICKIVSDGFSLSNDLHDPIGAMRYLNMACVRAFREQFPVAYHVGTTVCAVFRGFTATFVFPLYSAIGALSLPIYAGVLTYKKYVKGDQSVGDKIKSTLIAWLFCLIALGGAASFLALSAFHLNLFQGTALVITGCAVSISIHVYRSLREPDPVLPEVSSNPVSD